MEKIGSKNSEKKMLIKITEWVVSSYDLYVNRRFERRNEDGKKVKKHALLMNFMQKLIDKDKIHTSNAYTMCDQKWCIHKS